MINSNEDGFTVIEAIVSFAIVSLVLVSLYEAISMSYRNTAIIKNRAQALASATSQLANIGIVTPLGQSKTEGTYSNGMSWRMTINPFGEPQKEARSSTYAVWVDLHVFDMREREAFKLKTIKLQRQ